MARPKEKLSAAIKRLASTKRGKKALSLHKRFWGIKHPPAIQRLNIPDGKRGQQIVVHLGRSPAIVLADGPRGRQKRIVRRRNKGIVVCDPSGRRLMILSKRSMNGSGPRRFIGYAVRTEYIPTRAVEKAGTFKKGRHWIHDHHDEGGKWPKVYRDKAGNYHYGPSTLRVGKWMRR